jgi:exodeoxyribonuclease V gamma subunit
MLTVRDAKWADALIGLLGELPLAAHGDVFDPEVITVRTRRVERWLAQQLALTLGAGGACDGVAAHIELPSPAALVDDVLAGLDAAADPCLGDRQFVLVFPENDSLVKVARAGLEGQFQGVGAVPLRENDGEDFSRDQPIDPQPRLEFFQ